MTDKPIIIDGVDVSKCKYFDCDYKECKAEYYVRHGYEIVKYDSCIENPNCYFKQLKQAKQKLENIKEICNIYQMECIVNNGVKLLTNKILQIIGDE